MVVTIENQQYQIGELIPWDVFHIVRKLGPVVHGLLPRLIQSQGMQTDVGKAAAIAALLVTDEGFRFTQVLSVLPREDLDFVAVECLKHVTLKQGDAWMPVITPNLPHPRSQHVGVVTLHVMLRLIMAVLTREIGSFLPVSRSASDESPTAAA